VAKKTNFLHLTANGQLTEKYGIKNQVSHELLETAEDQREKGRGGKERKREGE